MMSIARPSPVSGNLYLAFGTLTGEGTFEANFRMGEVYRLVIRAVSLA